MYSKEARDSVGFTMTRGELCGGAQAICGICESLLGQDVRVLVGVAEASVPRIAAGKEVAEAEENEADPDCRTDR